MLEGHRFMWNPLEWQVEGAPVIRLWTRPRDIQQALYITIHTQLAILVHDLTGKMHRIYTNDSPFVLNIAFNIVIAQ